MAEMLTSTTENPTSGRFERGLITLQFATRYYLLYYAEGRMTPKKDNKFTCDVNQMNRQVIDAIGRYC